MLKLKKQQLIKNKTHGFTCKEKSEKSIGYTWRKRQSCFENQRWVIIPYSKKKISQKDKWIEFERGNSCIGFVLYVRYVELSLFLKFKNLN